MPELTENQLNEIAGDLECGFRCYWNHKTGELLSLADREDPLYDGNEIWEADYERVDEQPNDYVEITKPGSNDTFRIMEEFALGVQNKRLKDKLVSALERSKPFRNFKAIIESEGKYRDDWFAFRRLKFKEYVQEQVDTALGKETLFDDEEE